MQVIEIFKAPYDSAGTPQANLTAPFWQLDLLKTFIEDSGDGIAAFDLHLNCVLWNRGMERLCGISASQAIGRSVFDTLLTPRDLRARESIFAALLGHTVTVQSEPLDRFVVRLDCYYSPLTNSLGSVDGGIVIVRPAIETSRLSQSRELSLSPLIVDSDLLDNLR